MVRHVLVIDDDRHITDLLRRTVAHAGYTVAIATSGSERIAVRGGSPARSHHFGCHDARYGRL